MNDIKIGIEIETIKNGYLVTAHKTNGWNAASTQKEFYTDLSAIENDLVNLVREAGDLDIEEPQPMGFPGVAF